MTETYDVLFLALARDCAATIPGALEGLNRLQDHGLRVHMVVGEDGSSDGTRELLEAATNGAVTVVDTSFMAGTSSRLKRMALGRQYVADQSADIASEIIAVVDLDEPFLERIEPEVFAEKTRRLKEGGVFALAASSRPSYYDLLAFEDENRSFTDLDQQIGKRRRNPIEYYKFFRDFIYPAQNDLTTDGDIVCRSAFNGLCLYPTEIYTLGSYLTDDENWICEHLTFNRAVAAKTGRHMVVDGSIKLPTPLEHGRRSLLGFVLQRAKKLPQKIGRN